MIFNNLMVPFVIGTVLGSPLIPPYLHVCHRSDPKIIECISNSIESLRSQLKQGIPELHVPSVEPLTLKEIKMRAGPNQAQINADLSNLQVWDITLLTVSDVTLNFEKGLIVAKVNLPHLYFKGDYDVDMNVLILKYKGKGVITGNFTDYKLDLTLKYDLIEIDGKEYIHFSKLGVRLYQGTSVIHLDGLFKNDPLLQNAISENVDLFMNEIMPVLEDSLSIELTEIANDITNTFAYEDLLPI